jgi:1-phosphofructokinase
MILTVCPNPSVDCTIELDFLNIGRLNRIRNKQETYAGKALNVALSIKRLGGDCIATGFMFEENGKQFIEKFTQEDVTCNFVWNPGAVRVNYKIIDNKSMMTEINDKGEMVSEDKQQELVDLTANLAQNCSIAVMSGSLPQGVNTDYYARLCQGVPSNVKKIVDTEGDALIDAIKAGVYMIKPNVDELERSLKESFVTRKDMINACRKLIDMGAENVLLSLGADGAILTNGSKSYFCKSANVAVNSTVGAGDSMVASACLQIEKGASMPEILRCAVAGGTASVATRTSLQFKEKYEEILGQLHIEVLNY